MRGCPVGNCHFVLPSLVSAHTCTRRRRRSPSAHAYKYLFVHSLYTDEACRWISRTWLLSKSCVSTTWFLFNDLIGLQVALSWFEDVGRLTRRSSLSLSLESFCQQSLWDAPETWSLFNDLIVSTETYLCQKRPTCVKRDLLVSKETWSLFNHSIALQVAFQRLKCSSSRSFNNSSALRVAFQPRDRDHIVIG